MEIKSPMDIPKLFPVRKSAKQKEAFRSAVETYLKNRNYPVTVEKGSLGTRNVIIGDPDCAKYLITAHYDTCARMIVPNLITPCSFWLFMLYQFFVAFLLIVPAVLGGILAGYLFRSYQIGYNVWMVLLWVFIIMIMVGPANSSNVNDNTSGVVTVLEIAGSLPENLRSQVCFVLFDLEEAGLIGSCSYQRKHKKATSKQLVLNLDCVGEGDEIYFFPTSKLKKNAEKLAAFDAICGSFGKKRISVRKKGFGIYPSDQGQFPYGMGICALTRGKLGLYLSKIHTPKDTVLDETNVNILRAALISLIGSTTAE